jgi:hypothetical protein
MGGGGAAGEAPGGADAAGVTSMTSGVPGGSPADAAGGGAATKLSVGPRPGAPRLRPGGGAASAATGETAPWLTVGPGGRVAPVAADSADLADSAIYYGEGDGAAAPSTTRRPPGGR